MARYPVLALLLCLTLLPDLALAQTLSDDAWQQIQALLHDKATRTPTQQKIGSQLLYALKQSRGDLIAPGLSALRARLHMTPEGTVLVDIKALVTPALLQAIAQAGGTIVTSVPTYNAMRARLPLSQVTSLATRPEVMSIRPAIGAVTSRRVLPHGTTRAVPNRLAVASGAAQDSARTQVLNVSQGDVAHQADLARARFGVDGTGIRIGVLSDSVDFLAAIQAGGDLPEVVVLPGQSGLGDPESTGEGTAMLEIVHDLAPAAELVFATAFGGPAAFAQNIRELRFGAGCDIIVDDVLYFDESPFQDGMITQAVNEVTADGALYFSSAGNEGNQNDGTSGVWEGDFVAGGTLALLPGGTVHNFGGSLANQLTDDAPFAVVLFWSDPLGGSGNDYDLFLLDATLTRVLAAATDVQNGDDDPFEIITAFARQAPCSGLSGGRCAAQRGERLVVVRRAGAASRFLHVNTLGGRLDISTAGQTHGHNSAVEAFGVAAVDVATAAGGSFVGGAANPVEPFSADGPRRVFYFPDGTPITPGDVSSTGGTVRQKPDIAAADGVVTATPGFARFFGTSAAAPHAAAIAALVWSANPALAPEEMRTILTTTALDIETAGHDRAAGAGLLDALAAVQTAVSEPPPQEVCPACQLTSGLVVGTELTGPGTAITIAVEVRSAPNAVHALGFDLPFDPTLLRFSGFTPGDLTVVWGFFDAFTVEPGRLRVGGFTIQDSIAAGASGRVVDLHFEVLACQQDEALPLQLGRLLDDIASWDTCAGCVACGCTSNGDVNQDGRLTPADALLTFRHFLDLADPPLDACQRGRADVLEPLSSTITPADSLCIFQKFLGLLSCLD